MKLVRANHDKPHRCPECHSIPDLVRSHGGKARWWSLYSHCGVTWSRLWHDGHGNTDPIPGRMVHHTPRWEPAMLRVDAAGNTKPGFVCVHELENGNGRCGADVFEVADAVGDHICFVPEETR